MEADYGRDGSNKGDHKYQRHLISHTALRVDNNTSTDGSSIGRILDEELLENLAVGGHARGLPYIGFSTTAAYGYACVAVVSVRCCRGR